LHLVSDNRGCGRRTEPDIAELVERYDADTPVPDSAAPLRRSKCGSREVEQASFDQAAVKYCRPDRQDDQEHHKCGGGYIDQRKG
jgi:hypothetical protein